MTLMRANLSLDNRQVFTVATPVYEGPLDLLLQLIEREELDITKLSLALVTNPFLEYVRKLQDHQAEEVSSFLIVAARLMQIKSEVLLPRPPEREPGEEDPGEELIEQLLKYKQYKEISKILNEKLELGHHTYVRMAPPLKVEGKLDLSGIGIEELTLAAIRIFEMAKNNKPFLGTVVKKPQTTIHDRILHIVQTLKKNKRSSFRKLLNKDSSRTDVVVTFLALLELVKQFKITAYQNTLFSDIEIEKTQDWDENPAFDVEFIE